jgi:hypothetical protein
VKIIEIFPPAVQSEFVPIRKKIKIEKKIERRETDTDSTPSAELHDAKHQPDIVNGRQIGMPLEDFTNQTMEKLFRGEEQIPIGLAARAFENVEVKRQEAFAHLIERMKGQGS